jgi:hypothetical protein
LVYFYIDRKTIFYSQIKLTHIHLLRILDTMSAEKGGCFCGKVRVEVAGEPDGHVSVAVRLPMNTLMTNSRQVLCHCLDCRKIGGAAFSNNFIVDSSNVKMEGW